MSEIDDKYNQIGSAKMGPRGIKLFALLFAGFLTLIAFGCCAKISPTREVSGQVFIVTRGGESIKLALVEISLYDASQAERAFTDWRQSVERECEPKFNELERQARVNLANAKIREQPLGREFMEWNANFILSIIESDRADLFAGAAAFQHLPKAALIRTKTDVDGKFSMLVPRVGSYVIAAAAKREIAGKTENYYWALRVRAAHEQILLNNDNLVSTDNADSVLHATNSDQKDCQQMFTLIENLIKIHTGNTARR
jgi:hypothetical protein